MNVKDRMFEHLHDAVFYLVLVAGSIVFTFIYELQYPTFSIHKLMAVGSLVLLHDYYQFFRDNKVLYRRVAIEGYVVSLFLVVLFVVSLFFVLSPVENKVLEYSFKNVWPLLLFAPELIVFFIEFAITMKNSYHEHTGGSRATKNEDSYNSSSNGNTNSIKIAESARSV